MSFHKTFLSIFLLFYASNCLNNEYFTLNERYIKRESNGHLKLTSDETKAYILKGMSSSNFMTAPLLWYSETSIKTLKNWGANVFRICYVPTYWKDEKEGIMKYNADIDRYELLENAYNKSLIKLYEVVDRLISNEIYTIINWHTLYQGYYNNHLLYTHQDIAKKFFIDISNKYPNNPYIIFELNNEDKEDWISISNYAKYLIPSIREISPQSLIIVGTPDMDGSPNKVEINPNKEGFLNYPNILYAFHIYPNGQVNWKTTSFEEAIKNMNMPIIVTEWSSSNGPNSYNEIFSLNLIKKLKKYKVSWCNYAWSDIDVNGNEFAITYRNKWDEKLNDDILCNNGKLVKFLLDNYDNKDINIPNTEENMKILNRMISRKWDGLIWQNDINKKIISITFDNKINDKINYYTKFNLGDTYSTNVIGYLIENKKYSEYYDLIIQSNGNIYANKDCSNLFRAFPNVNYINLNNFIITKETTNTAMMFYGLGSTQYTNYTMIENLTVILGNNFDSTSVTNMESMFEDIGSRSNKVIIDLGYKFNDLNVINMNKMFKNMGGYDKNFVIDLSEFNFEQNKNVSYINIFDRWKNKNRTILVKDEKIKEFVVNLMGDNAEGNSVIAKENKYNNGKIITNNSNIIKLLLCIKYIIFFS